MTFLPNSHAILKIDVLVEKSVPVELTPARGKLAFHPGQIAFAPAITILYVGSINRLRRFFRSPRQ
jgi:hypothetical protein